MNPRLARAWDRLTLYLPLLLMGVLALGTYVLTRSQQSPGEVARPVEQQTPHDADYAMRGFAVRSFEPGGLLQTELRGHELRHYPDTDTLEVDRLHLRHFDEHGRLTQAQAQRGFATGNGSDVTLTGQAQLMRPAGTVDGQTSLPLQVNSELLHLRPQANQLRTDRPVRVLHGPDVIDAGHLTLDGQARTLSMGGRVRVVIQPRPGPLTTGS